MTEIRIEKDVEKARLHVAAEYAATPEQVWDLWADPRKLERWWGPPTYPATVTEHAFEAGGVVRYYMTGPDGQQFHGGWRIKAVKAPNRLEFEDFFADEWGQENADLPVSRTVVSVTAEGKRTRMTMETQYASPEALAQVLEMGMEEGLRGSMSQIDALLAG